jgi:hypothetical protein
VLHNGRVLRRIRARDGGLPQVQGCGSHFGSGDLATCSAIFVRLRWGARSWTQHLRDRWTSLALASCAQAWSPMRSVRYSRSLSNAWPSHSRACRPLCAEIRSNSPHRCCERLPNLSHRFGVSCPLRKHEARHVLFTQHLSCPCW